MRKITFYQSLLLIFTLTYFIGKAHSDPITLEAEHGSTLIFNPINDYSSILPNNWDNQYSIYTGIYLGRFLISPDLFQYLQPFDNSILGEFQIEHDDNTLTVRYWGELRDSPEDDLNYTEFTEYIRFENEFERDYMFNVINFISLSENDVLIEEVFDPFNYTIEILSEHGDRYNSRVLTIPDLNTPFRQSDAFVPNLGSYSSFIDLNPNETFQHIIRHTISRAQVPEPSNLACLAIGLCSLFGFGYHRFRKQS